MSLFSQTPNKEFSNWLVAENNHFHFIHDSLIISTITNIPVNSINGHAFKPITVSDSSGNLLFYTDCFSNLYDGSHSIVVDLKDIDSTITNSAYFSSIKIPNSNSYYLLSRYKKAIKINVDVNTNKITVVDTLFDSPFTVACDYINHPNKKSIWLSSIDNTIVQVYEINSSGNFIKKFEFDISPYLPTGYIGLLNNDIIKFSYNGNFLFLGFTVNFNDIFKRETILAKLEFDKIGGILTNYSSISFDNTISPHSSRIIDIETSLNSKYVYFSALRIENTQILDGIYQCPIEQGFTGHINNFCTKLDPHITYPGGFEYAQNTGYHWLRLAIDSKIYISRVTSSDSALSVINYPDKSGDSCDLNFFEVKLQNKSPIFLPNKVLPSLFYPEIKYDTSCSHSETKFWIAFADSDSILWDFGDGNHKVTVNDTVTHLYKNDGNFTVFATLFHNGQQDTVSNLIQVHPLPNLDLGNDTLLCDGNILPISIFDSSIVSYSWSVGHKTSEIEISESGTYSVVVANEYCSAQDSIMVTFINCEIVAENVCFPDTVYISSIAEADSILWDFGDGDTLWGSNKISHYYPYADSFKVEAFFYYKGMSISKEKWVRVFENPSNTQVNIIQISDCEPVEIRVEILSDLHSNIFYKLYWGDGDSVMSSQGQTGPYLNYTYKNNGIYFPQLRVQTFEGKCSALISLDSIIVHPKPMASFTFTPEEPNIENREVRFHNLSTGSEQYKWIILPFGEYFNFEPTIFYNDSGLFPVTLIAISENNCQDTAEGNVYVRALYKVFFPSAFSPNNDGFNDQYFPAFIGVSEFNFRIYNRWGEMVFQTTTNNGWDGTFEGNLSPQGVYAFVAEVRNDNGESQSFSGTITLLR